MDPPQCGSMSLSELEGLLPNHSRASANQVIESLVSNKELSDVTFQVGVTPKGKDSLDSTREEETIPGIRALFACHSPVFKKMLFDSKMSESKPNSTVTINDINPKHFKTFQRYCYNLNPSINIDNVVSLLYISDKYLVANLNDCCLKFIETKIINNNKITDIDCFLYLVNNLIYQFGLSYLSNNSLLNKILTKYQCISTLSEKDCLGILNSNYFYHLHYCIVQELLFNYNCQTRKYLLEKTSTAFMRHIENNFKKDYDIKDKNRISIEYVWCKLVAWSEIQTQLLLRNDVNTNVDKNSIDNGHGVDYDEKKKEVGDMGLPKIYKMIKDYFCDTNLIAFKSMNVEFYMKFIDPISNKLFSLEQINNILRSFVFGRLEKNNNRNDDDNDSSELCANSEIIQKWFAPSWPTKPRWDQTHHIDGIKFIHENRVQFNGSSGICVSDFCIKKNKFDVFAWEITIHKYSNGSVFGMLIYLSAKMFGLE